MNYTKGKWTLKNKNPQDLYIREGEKGKVICEITTTGLIEDQDECEANAKLIEAAPELLEAIIETNKWWEKEFEKVVTYWYDNSQWNMDKMEFLNSHKRIAKDYLKNKLPSILKSEQLKQ